MVREATYQKKKKKKKPTKNLHPDQSQEKSVLYKTAKNILHHPH